MGLAKLPETSVKRSLLASVAASLAMAALVFAGPAVAQAPKEVDAATIAAAKKEGMVTFYSAAVQEQNDSLVQAFQAAYGIKMNVIRAGGGIIQSRLEGDFQANRVQADIADLTDRLYLDTISGQGRLADLQSLPAYADFPANAKAKNYVFTSAQPDVIGFNTDKVKASDIKSWEDVVSPRWKDAITLVDPRSSNTIAAFFLGLDRRYGDDYLRKLAAMNPKVFNSGTPSSQLIVSGEAAIGFPLVISVFPSLKDSGAPIDYVLLGSPNTGPIHYIGVLSQAPHPNAAKVFMNFLTDRPGQAAWNGGGLGASFLPDIPGAAALGPNFETPEQVPPSELARVSELLGLR